MNYPTDIFTSSTQPAPNLYGRSFHPSANNQYGSKELRRNLLKPFKTPALQRIRSIQDRPNEAEPNRDFEMPLDAFDQELLAEASQHQQDRAGRNFERITFPGHRRIISNRFEANDTIKNDLHYVPAVASSSSSSYDLPSSPTHAAVQNRLKGSNNTSYQRTSVHDSHRQPQSQRSQSQKQPLGQERNNYIHSSHIPPTIKGIQLVPTSQLPDQLRSIFKFEIFNAVQSKCFTAAYHTDDNMVLAAPTGSGKTAVMEIAICRLLSGHKGKDFKIIYQAPTKSLCSERYRDWQSKFSGLDLHCAELTGDTEYTHFGDVQKADVIITTPEKWDSVTRKWKDHLKLMQMIKLFLVDEVHILKESRGATLEAVVSRMKSFGSAIRFVALSATVPNSEDIATWLGKNSSSSAMPAHREVFGEGFRPVKLEKHVYGLDGSFNEWIMDRNFRTHVPDIISKHSKGKPTMVFCSTRQSVCSTATLLAETWANLPQAKKPWAMSRRVITVGNADLKKLVPAGVAFHHGGLTLADRQSIEQGFLQGDIKVICSTSTLAVGVNLPCYLVVLQGTVCYSPSGMQEYSDLEIMQMLGRAGRPQFETSACAVILTRQQHLTRYQKMVAGEEVLESCLHENLIEHLNAEISLGTVYDLESAKSWLKSSFLNVRLEQNPDHYRFKEGINPRRGDELILRLCEKDINLLRESDLLVNNDRLQSSEFGNIMARYYITFETMKIILAIPPKAKISEILSALSQATEFHEVRMKANEKSFYKELNKANRIKYPIKVDVASQAHKISLILQAELGGVPPPDGPNYVKHHNQNRVDKTVVFGHANRLIRCIIDCQLHLEDAVSARNALELGRCIAGKVWEDTPDQLRQLTGIGDVAVKKLASANINNIETLLNVEPHRIELALSKSPPFGHELLKRVSCFPDLRILVKEVSRELKMGNGATIKIKADIGFINATVPTVFSRTPVYVCFLAETSDGRIIDFRRFGARKLQNGEDILLTVSLNRPTQLLRCHVMCDAIAGTVKYAELPVGDIPVSIYPVVTEVRCTKENDTSTEENTLQQHANIDSFDDSIEDGDLLAAEVDHADGIEMVQDIDDLLNEEHNLIISKEGNVPTQRQIPAKQSYTSADEKAVSDYHQPSRLSNGKWTCQHTCNDRGVECKHRCCKEGVSKAKRPPKTAAHADDRAPKQQKITKSMATLDKSHPDSRTQPATKLPKPHNSTTNPVVNGVSRVRSSTKSRSVCLERFGRQKEKNTKGSSNTYHGRHRSPPPGSISVAHDDLESNSIKRLDLMQRENDQYDDFDLDTELFGVDDCDWNVGKSNGHSVQRLNDCDVSSPPLETSQRLSLTTSTTDADEFGEFSPPVTHVNMADLHNHTVEDSPVSNQSSTSGQKTSSSTTISCDSMNDSDKALGSCGFDDLDLDVDDFVNFDQVEVDTSTTTNMVDNAPSKPDLDVVVGPKESDTTETEEAKAKRLHEEEQKKKWEGLDPWLYEQFHDIVDIVDEEM